MPVVVNGKRITTNWLIYGPSLTVADPPITLPMNHGTVISTVIGQVVETDTAQAIAVNPKRRLISQATEADLAQAIVRIKTKLPIQTIETDFAQLISRLKSKTLGQATETDSAQSITLAENKIVPVSQATETDSAQPIEVVKASLQTSQEPVGGAPPWHTEAWRRKRYKKWDLPPPTFPEITEEPIGVPTPMGKPSWLTALEQLEYREPVSRRLVYHPIVDEIAQPMRLIVKPPPVRDVLRGTHDEVGQKTRKDEEELLSLLIMQGAIH